jgi:ribosomal protein S18 acetylase RimI-like enzyme
MTDRDSGVEIRPARSLLARRTFVDVPFRIHGGDPGWVPPLRMSVYDRISPKHPATAHQEVALWVAYRRGRPVGRIAACIDRAFNDYQGVRWGWVGFFDTFDDPQVSDALFRMACTWSAERGMDTCVGPANFTTNDELGLLVEGFDQVPALLTLQNPPYYVGLWERAGWEPAMDLWAWRFDKATTALSERQRRTLDRIQRRAAVRVRHLNLADFDNEVTRFFEVYNAAWQDNWGFAPMPEPEVRHLAKQLKQILNPEWAFGLETASGSLVGVCLALPDMNLPMLRVRSGRLLPTGWIPLLRERRRVPNARVWALGVRPDYQHLALGPLLYREIVDRLAADPYIRTAEASWTLASNHRINDQLAAMGAARSKVWRLYQRPAQAPIG